MSESLAKNISGGFLKKLDAAIGWYVLPDLEAMNTFVEGVKKDERLSLLEKSAAIYNSRKIIKEYINQHNIVKIALEQFDGSEKPDAVDDDWLSHFFDEARHVSNEDIQKVWGIILANEFKKPGSVPKALLHTLSYIEQETAISFNILAKFVMQSVIPVAVIDWKQKAFFNKEGLHYRNFAEMESNGLIKFDTLTKFQLKLSKIELHYFGKDILVKSEKNCPVGNVHLTDVGISLYLALSPEKASDEYISVCKNYWESHNCTVDISG